MRTTLLALAIVGCAAHPGPHVAVSAPMPPETLQTCPAAIAAPKPPPAPRSVATLLGWAIAVDRAREETEAARAECARRLNALNNWIVGHR